VDDALQQLQTVDDTLQQLQTQADDALQQARVMLPQRANEIYRTKVGDRLERIMAEFEAAYPKALERVAAAYPDLTPTERRIFVLSHLQFRAKEMADLLGLSENTVNQYRYNLRKKTENTSFSAFLD
jgi:DNA-binding CsgD family transcriptional regulator